MTPSLPTLRCAQSRSARGKKIIDSSRDPESPRASQIQLTATERNIFVVRDRSSFQLKSGCFIPDVPPPPLSPTGRSVTRTQLLARRRLDWVADNERTSLPVERSCTFPMGSVPGAPGKTPGYKPFKLASSALGETGWH